MAPLTSGLLDLERAVGGTADGWRLVPMARRTCISGAADGGPKVCFGNNASRQKSPDGWRLVSGVVVTILAVLVVNFLSTHDAPLSDRMLSGGGQARWASEFLSSRAAKVILFILTIVFSLFVAYLAKPKLIVRYNSPTDNDTNLLLHLYFCLSWETVLRKIDEEHPSYVLDWDSCQFTKNEEKCAWTQSYVVRAKWQRIRNSETEMNKLMGNLNLTQTKLPKLSHVGQAAYRVLDMKHSKLKGECWDLSHGMIEGQLAQTPPKEFWENSKISENNCNTHSDEFPTRFGSVLAAGETFIDLATLSPPTGKFLKYIRQALINLHNKKVDVTVRFLTGNVIFNSTDNEALLDDLRHDEDGNITIPSETKVKLWIGSYRKGFTWNHSKILAVDGNHLLQGGHNLSDVAYLQHNPARDVSMEVKGAVSVDAHKFCNRMWKYISKNEKLKSMNQYDAISVDTSIVSWPRSGNPEQHRDVPMYKPSKQTKPEGEKPDGHVSVISVGRFGALHRNAHSANPSDSAFVAMLSSAKTSIKMSLQDLGPMAYTLQTGTITLPNAEWPTEYLEAVGKAISRGVKVDIVLCPPEKYTADTEVKIANRFGNGWTCEDVASKIVEYVKEPSRDLLRNLRVSYMRSSLGSQDWYKDGHVANHAKIFIVDDMCYYIGSQNLYVCDLSEWGLIIDDTKQTQTIMKEYWEPMWKASFVGWDCNMDEVLKEAWGGNTSPETGPENPHHLSVWVHSATNLRDADAFGMSDPVVVLQLKKDGKTLSELKTKVVKDGGPDLIWNEQLTFEGLDDKLDDLTLKAVVWDSDRFFDDHLGEKTVSLSGLSPTFKQQKLALGDANLFIALRFAPSR